MDIEYSQFHKLDSFLLHFFPHLHFKQQQLNQDNADLLIRYIMTVVDAILKAENLYKKRNLVLADGKSFFTQDIVELLGNCSLFLYKFDASLFSFNRTERQTFIFIMDNLVDYYKRCRFFVDQKDRHNLFVDYRFWFDNFFKIINQKISGVILSSKKLNLMTFFNASENSGTELVYSNNLVNFNLSPFVIHRDNHTLFLQKLNNGELLYQDVWAEKEILIKNPRYDLKVYEFLVANFEFENADLLKEKLKKEKHILLDKYEDIKTALNYHKERLYLESYNHMKNFSFETLDLPLLYLMQIKNLVNLNRTTELKKLMQEFVQRFDYYPDGYEIMADICFKDEDWEMAATFYERVLNLTQNKRVGEKLKKVRELQEKSNEKLAKQKNDNFYDITESVYRRANKLFPRLNEERQMLEILLSDSHRNVLLVGDKGVGKTSLIERLAQRIINNEVPTSLKEKCLYEINFVTLLTSSKYRGQFEEKVLKLLEDFRSKNALLVLEDVHLMITTGVPRGTALDLPNILKLFLREKSIQVIATSSYEEYKNSIEKDNTLMAYFQKITVNEMPAHDTRLVLRDLAEDAFSTDKIMIPNEVLELILETASRDIRDRKNPDAAVMIFERALAKVKYKSLTGEFNKFKMETSDVEEVLADLLNLPETNLPISLKQRLSNLKEKILAHIVGQDEAIDRMVTTIITAKMNLDIKKGRPDGVFLFIGPTGVGKTESAIALTKALYGSTDNLIRIDMSEYMEKYTYSRFVGAAPGYIGYMDANQLTDKVRQNPYSVILLDEIEKADAQLLNIFLQVFDAGRMTDARGNVIDFSHATIIMTSNIGTNLFSRTQMGYQSDLDGAEVSHTALLKALKKYFSPEFLNRVDEVLIFNHLTPAHIRTIIDILLKETRTQLLKEQKELVIHQDVLDFVIKNGYSKEYGARFIGRTLRQLVLDKIALATLDKSWDETRQVICTLDHEKDQETVYVQLAPYAIEHIPQNNYLLNNCQEHSGFTETEE